MKFDKESMKIGFRNLSNKLKQSISSSKSISPYLLSIILPTIIASSLNASDINNTSILSSSSLEKIQELQMGENSIKLPPGYAAIIDNENGKLNIDIKNKKHNFELNFYENINDLKGMLEEMELNFSDIQMKVFINVVLKKENLITDITNLNSKNFGSFLEGIKSSSFEYLKSLPNYNEKTSEIEVNNILKIIEKSITKLAKNLIGISSEDKSEIIRKVKKNLSINEINIPEETIDKIFDKMGIFNTTELAKAALLENLPGLLKVVNKMENNITKIIELEDKTVVSQLELGN